MQTTVRGHGRPRQTIMDDPQEVLGTSPFRMRTGTQCSLFLTMPQIPPAMWRERELATVIQEGRMPHAAGSGAIAANPIEKTGKTAVARKKRGKNLYPE